MRSVRRKAESVSLSDEIIALALHARLRAQHPLSVDKSVRSRIRFESLADKRFLRSSGRYRLANADSLTGFDPESRRLVIFLSLPRQHQQERAHRQIEPMCKSSCAGVFLPPFRAATENDWSTE